jgi:hypothetical protein
MRRQKDIESPEVPELIDEGSEENEPGLVDGIRFLYRRRVKLAFRTAVLFCIGTVILGFMYLFASRTVEGIISLKFSDIKINRYPGGRKFSVEDFRSPDVLAKALQETGISIDRLSAKDTIEAFNALPIIPAEIQSRWKKQDKDGAKKDEYTPTDFRISIHLGTLSGNEGLRLFDAWLVHYRESVKYDLSPSGIAFLSRLNDKIKGHDPWDVPELFRQTDQVLRTRILRLVQESSMYPDSRFNLMFRKLWRELFEWERIRLQALEAVTYEGSLVGNQDMAVQKIKYRIDRADAKIRQLTQEANEALGLLKTMDRPKTLIAGEMATGGMSFDTEALDKLLKSDYVGPVVQRVSEIQTKMSTSLEEKAESARQLAKLNQPNEPKRAGRQSDYQEILEKTSRELNAIIQIFNQTLENYLSEATYEGVSLIQMPIVSKNVISPLIALPALTILSILLGIFLLAVEHLWQRVRKEENVPAQLEQAKAVELSNI